jgi:dipeptidase
MWGAEMGVNEHGLAIGNEAVFTRIPYAKEGGLTGMDLLRLALERSRTAREAVLLITELLGRYGQGGNCGFRRPFHYHNSFLIADPETLWLLETAGPHWNAARIHGAYALSNGLSIDGEGDLSSPELLSTAVRRGWCKGKSDFAFARTYSDRLFTTFSDCRRRRRRVSDLLGAFHGNATVRDAFRILRDHGGDARWRPDRGITGAAVCMHAGFGPVRASQTTGSLVVHLHPRRRTCFVTATAAPCTGIFKPLWSDTGTPDTGPPPAGCADDRSLFWRHERLHRAVVTDYADRAGRFTAERDALEAAFVQKALAATGAPVAERAVLSARCFQEAAAAEEGWEKALRNLPLRPKPNRLYRFAWHTFNRQAGLTPHPSGRS